MCLEHSLALSYFIYGLKLNVNVEIPGLNPEKTVHKKPDIKIVLGSIPDEILKAVSQPEELYYSDQGLSGQGDTASGQPSLVVNTIANGEYFHFRYQAGVDFICDKRARQIWGKWDSCLDIKDVVAYLLGPILGFCLRLRGITCLHASGVEVNGTAIALSGPSGVGKSTLAAAFAAAGHRVLSDDVIPLKHVGDEFHAVAGYPHIRLYPNSFKNLEGIPNELPELMSDWDKCYLDLTTTSYEFRQGSSPLKVIYLLDWNTESGKGKIEICQMAPGAAVSILAANTYRNELLDAGMKRKEFLFLCQLAKSIPVKKIRPVDDINEVPNLLEAIISDSKQM